MSTQKQNPVAAKAAAGSFDPKNLTPEQQEAVVEMYLGVHPKYFIYSGLNIKLNHGLYRHDGHAFNGWKPKADKYNNFGG